MSERDEMLGAAMLAAKAASVKAARLEPAELVWWRAQLRKRQAAMERVGGPIRGVQAFTAALVLCVAVLVAALSWGAWGECLRPVELLVSMVSTVGLVLVAMVVCSPGWLCI